MEAITRFEYRDDQLLTPYSVNPGLSTGGMKLSDCLIFQVTQGDFWRVERRGLDGSITATFHVMA